MFKKTLNIMLYRQENAHFLTMLTALMAFIASLILIGFLLSQKVLKRWDIDLSTNITVQIIPDFKSAQDSTKNLEYRSQKTAKLLTDKSYLGDVQIISNTQAKQMLEPWLGSNWQIGDVPMPTLIAARIVDPSNFNINNLSDELNSKIGNVVVENHYNRLSQVRTMAKALGTSLWLVIFLVGLGVGLAVVYSTKASLDINHNILEILSNVGALENYIALLFAKKILISSILGGILGAIACIPAFMLLNKMLLSALGYDLIGIDEFLYLLLVPASFALVALITAQLTVYSKLKKLYI